MVACCLPKAAQASIAEHQWVLPAQHAGAQKPDFFESGAISLLLCRWLCVAILRHGLLFVSAFLGC